MNKTLRLAAVFFLGLASFTALGKELHYKKFIEQNAKSLAKISVGMTKHEVLQVMGDITSAVPDENLKNP